MSFEELFKTKKQNMISPEKTRETRYMADTKDPVFKEDGSFRDKSFYDILPLVREYYRRSEALSGGTNLESLTFKTVNIWRDVLPSLTPFEEEKKNNVLPFYRQRFNENILHADCKFMGSRVLSGAASTKSISDGILTITNSTGAMSEELLYTKMKLPVPHFCISLAVDSVTAGQECEPQLGITMDDDNHIMLRPRNFAPFDIVLQVKEGGAFHDTVLDNISLTPPYKLLMMFSGNTVFAFYREDGKRWHYLDLVDYTAYFNLFDNAVLASFNPFFGYRSSDTKVLSFIDFRVFFTPQFGIRDQTIVSFQDGSPYIKDNKVYFTATIGGGIRYSTLGVFRMDITNYDVEFIGLLFNNSETGKTYDDTAVHVMYDENRHTWFVFWSGWSTYQNGGDAYCLSYVSSTKTCPLFGVHILKGEKMNIAATTNYDPFVIYDEATGKWYCTLVHSGISVYSTTDNTFKSSWTLVSNYDTGTNEGPKVQRINNKLKVSWGNNTAVKDMYCADFPSLTNVQSINLDTATGVPMPHPMVIPIYRHGKTEYLLLSFDQTPIFGLAANYRGNMWVYKADEIANGYEYPIRDWFKALFR